jgi:hypothetical protein
MINSQPTFGGTVLPLHVGYLVASTFVGTDGRKVGPQEVGKFATKSQITIETIRAFVR